MVKSAPSPTRWDTHSLMRLIIPLIIEQLLAVSIGMADTVMVATVSEAAVSGISLVETINVLLINIFSALAAGGAVVVSQYLGSRQPDKASMASKQLIYSITLVSLVVSAFALFFHDAILHLIYGRIAPDVMTNAQTYFLITAISYPFLAVYNGGAAIYRSMGNSKVSMLISILVNLTNIGGNALLIFRFHLGVAGAAISTLASRILAALVILALLMRKESSPITLSGLLPIKREPAMIKSIFKIGIPNGLEGSTFQVGKLLVARLVSSYGTSAIAGNALAGNLATFINVVGIAIGLALVTVVGQAVGAKDFQAARYYTKKLLRISHLIMILVGIILILLINPILSLFSLSSEAIAITRQSLLLFASFAGFFWPPSFALPNALRAAGDAKFTMVVSMFSMWVFRIGASYFFAETMGFQVLGVWMAMILDWMVRALAFKLRWKGDRWQQHSLIH